MDSGRGGIGRSPEPIGDGGEVGTLMGRAIPMNGRFGPDWSATKIRPIRWPGPYSGAPALGSELRGRRGANENVGFPRASKFAGDPAQGKGRQQGSIKGVYIAPFPSYRPHISGGSPNGTNPTGGAPNQWPDTGRRGSTISKLAEDPTWMLGVLQGGRRGA